VNDKQRKAIEEWCQGRPLTVRKLAEEFPPFTIIKSGCDCHKDTVVVGYTENDELICSEVDMFGNFDVRVSKLYAKAQDLRDGKVKIERRDSYDKDAGKDGN
jgi:hypothetical protein